MTQHTRKIVAGALSIAMVLTLVVGFAASTSAQTTTAAASYSRNLTVGSTGTDVTALQATLYAAGYLKVAPTGYFGSLTKAALAAWQASVGISPASGYFGPITRAYLATNGSSTGTGSTVPGCTAGAMYSSTTGQPCSTGTTGTTTGGTLDNMDGSLTVASSTVVSASGITLKKGESKDVIAAKLTATAGKVAITRFDTRFNVRPWLYFSKFELIDQNTGAVVSTKNVSSMSDFTEISAGTDYLLRFDNINYVVTPGTESNLKVRATVLGTTDKLSSDQAVVVSLPDNGIRTVNGKGYTDSVGFQRSTTVTLTSTGSNGTVTARVSANNLSARTVTTSTTGQTNAVELLKLELKSENQSSTVNALSFLFTSTGSEITKIVKSVRLTDGTNTYYGSIATTTTFSSLNIALPVDTYKTLTLVADIADQDDFVTGSQLTVGLNSAVTAYDANYTNISSVSGSATSSAMTLQNVGVNVTSPAVTNVTVNTNTGGSATSAQGTFTFTLTNNSNDSVYVSSSAATLLNNATSTSNGTTPASISFGSVSASGGTLGADTANYFVVPNGQSRTFSVLGVLSDTNTTLSIKDLNVTTIKYGTSTSALANFSVTTGIDNKLKLEASI